MIQLLKKSFWLVFASLFVFALFLQDRFLIRKVFWNDNFVEYQSLALYPFFLVVLVALTIIIISKIKHKEKFNWGPPFLLILFGFLALLILVTGILGINPLVSFSFLIMLLFGVGCYLVILNTPVEFRFWQLLIIGFVFLESVLGITQMILQSSTGLKFLIGEPVLNPSELGIGVIEWSGHRLLRAYGNFPHPNILGGVLAIGLVFLVSFYLALKKRKRLFNLLFVFSFGTIWLGLLFSFSRSAWLSLALIVLGFAVSLIIYRFKYKLTQDLRNKIFRTNLILVVCLVLSVILFSSSLKVRFDPEGVTAAGRITKTRMEYFNEAFELAKTYWFRGTGAGNYVRGVFDQVSSKDKGFLYQPVHNVPALILIELGLGGVIWVFAFTVYWVKLLWQKLKKGLKRPAVVSFLVTTLGLFILVFANIFDHYLWSSMIGFFLFWFLIGLGIKSYQNH